MNSNLIEEIANEFLVEGVNEKDIEKKREYFSISWGFNRYLERVDFMTLCTRFLQASKLNPEQIKSYQNDNYGKVIYALNLAEEVEKKIKASKKQARMV